MNTIDMKMLWAQTRGWSPSLVIKRKLSFYVRPAANRQYAGLMFDPAGEARVAKGNALYKINVQFK